MKFWFGIGGLVLVAAGFYWIWSDVNGLVLVEQTKDGYYYSYTLANDGKPKTAFSFNFLAQDQGIYRYLVIPFAVVGLVFMAIGGILGFWSREPIDKFDFEALKAKTEKELDVAWSEVEKAREAAKNAQNTALKQARKELETEKAHAEYQREEAEKERRAAIKAQQEAEAQVKKAQIERTDALRVADTATRKKNAAYSAAERFKRRAEKEKASRTY